MSRRLARANKTATAERAQGMLLSWGLRKIIRLGALILIDADGRTHEFIGAGGPSCTVRLHERSLHRSLVASPWLHVGEAYMDGTLTIEDGTLGDLIEILCLNAAIAEALPLFRLTRWFGYRMRWLQ